MDRRAGRKGWRGWLGIGLVLLTSCVLAASSQAADLTVDGGATYTVNSDISYTNEIVGQNSSGTINQSGFSNTVSNDLTLGQKAGSSANYNLSGGNLAVTGTLSTSETIGAKGNSTFNQSGGTNATSWLILGYDSGGKEVYNLSNGSLAARVEQVGYSGSGSFNQVGGNNTTAVLYLAIWNGSGGTYELSGGTLTANNEFIGFGLSKNGTFNQSGGSNTVATLGSSSSYLSINGTYNLIGGKLSVDSQTAINGGTFNQMGGNFDCYYLSLDGTYNLNNGNLTTFSEAIGMGTGTFNQSGGSHVVTGALVMGWNVPSSGTYNLSDGSLVAESERIGLSGNGNFNQTGGTNTTKTLTMMGYNGGISTYNLVGGSLSAQSELIGEGGNDILNQSGGTNTTVSLSIGNYLGNSSGTYNLGSGSLIAGTINLDDGGTFNQTGGGLNAAVFNQQGGIVTGVLENRGIFNYFNGSFAGSLLNYGTVNVGSGITFNIGSNYTQMAAGNYLLGIGSPMNYGKMNITGNASLNGTLTPALLGGYRPQPNQIFSGILTATGGISGNFSSVGNFTPTLVGIARYNPNSVDLLVQRDYTSQVLSLTGNQATVGRMLNGLANTASGDLNTVLNAIDGLTDPGAVANAYQQLSPDKAVALPILAFTGANLQKRTLSRRITDLRFGPADAGTAGGLGAFNLGYARGEGLMLAYNSNSLAGLLTGSRLTETGTKPWGLYLDPAMILGGQTTSTNQTGFHYTIAGFNAGVDYRVRDDLLVGLASGYSHTGAAFLGSGGSVAADTWPLTAYAAYLPKSFYAYGSLGYSLNLFNLERNLSFGDLNRTAKSAPSGNMFNAYGEAGYDLKARRLVVTPAVSLAYSRLWVDGFTESDAGALNLKVAPQNAESLQTGLGGKIALPIQRNSTTVVPQIYAFYQHELSNSSSTLDARLSQAGNTFAFQTEAPARNFAVLGANFTITAKKNLRIQLDYNAEVGRGNFTAHYVSGGLRYEF